MCMSKYWFGHVTWKNKKEALWTIVGAFNRAVFYYYKENIDLFTQKKKREKLDLVSTCYEATL